MGVAMLGRKVMLDNLVAGITDEELDYLVRRIGSRRVAEVANAQNTCRACGGDSSHPWCPAHEDDGYG
jgi:hypothetical protein